MHLENLVLYGRSNILEIHGASRSIQAGLHRHLETLPHGASKGKVYTSRSTQAGLHRQVYTGRSTQAGLHRSTQAGLQST